MSIKTATQPVVNMGGIPEIVIERRETVAIIRASSEGERGMLAEAFLQAGNYILEEARSDRGIELSWEWEGATFRASHEPMTQPIKGRELDPYEDD